MASGFAADAIDMDVDEIDEFAMVGRGNNLPDFAFYRDFADVLDNAVFDKQ